MSSNQDLADLGIALDDAVEGGLLGDSQSQTKKAIASAKERTAYRYLFLLGYLKRLPPDVMSNDGDKSIKWRERIEVAIRRFQNDCEMPGTGILSSETWNALLELASFDNPTDVSRWFSDGEPLPVLKRAVKIRLYAFGLSNRLPKDLTGIPSKDKELEMDYQKGLNGFARATHLLRLGDVPLEPALTQSTVETMFDQGEIIRRLSMGEGVPRAYQPPGDSDKRQKKNTEFANRFVRSVARVELWLFGYGVRIGSGKDKDRIQRIGGTLSLSAALNQFSETHADDQVFAKTEKDTIPVSFFRRVIELRSESDDVEDTVDADVIVGQVLEDSSIASQVLTGLKSFGSRLWDGVKRVWRWFKGGIKKLFDKAKRIAKTVISNITRYIHNAATKVFDVVRAAVIGVKDGLNLLGKKVLRGSNPDHIVINHDRDFDLEVFVNKCADFEYVANLTERLVERSKVFRIATKIVGSLFDIFLGIIRRGVTSGWFGLLLSLAKLGKAIKTLWRYSEEEMVLLERLQELKAEN